MRVALYAGTFDPITCGHLSVIERAARLFDRVVVVVAVNPNKQPLFSADERVEMIREVVAAWRNVECASTGGYVVELPRASGARYLVRGVRSGDGSATRDDKVMPMDGHGDELPEVPVAELLDALELPRAAVARWMDHLDAFFARHGGPRRYGDLARLTAETRAALAAERERVR